jgi:hypothetical protein
MVWPVKRTDSIRTQKWALEFKFERDRDLWDDPKQDS